MPHPVDDPAAKPGPSVLDIFLVFGRIGLSSFGGGLSGWLLRELVTRRHWIEEEEFLNGLAVSQALPGVNITNMSVWMGYRLHGSSGAAAALAGMIVPPAIVLLVIATAFDRIAHFPLVAFAIMGAGAAAIGLSLAITLRTANRVPRKAVPLAVMAATFAAVAFLHVPTLWAVVGFSAVSVALAWRGAEGRGT